MNQKKQLKEWLDQIYDPDERKKGCGKLMDRLPAYIDAVVPGTNANGKFADIQQHLDTCSDCAELYRELLNLARLEEEGRLPEFDDLLADLAGEEAVAAAPLCSD